MGRSKVMRQVGDPVVAVAPAGVRIRTRIHPTAEEANALTVIGALLGGLYRAELAGRIRCGVLDGKQQSVWRAERKQAVTALSSSRWAGAITRAVEDQYQLGMRGLAAHVADLRAAIVVLAERCALRPGEQSRRRGYRTTAERFAKTRRLAVLRARLAAAEKALAAGRPSVTVGGKHLWRNRNHLDRTAMTEQQWHARWAAARLFLTADGEAGKAGGNETIRVDDTGRLRVKVPVALLDEFGTRIVLDVPVRFAYREQEWARRVAARQAVRYDISYKPAKDRWYLDASWKTTATPSATLAELRAGRVLGVDLNVDHLACCVLDSSGNPVGEPTSIDVVTAGLRSTRRDARVRAAITTLLDYAERTGCAAIVVENLNFADARSTGRETMGRGARGKRFRRIVAGIPTAKFWTRLTAMAARRGISVIGVDAAYTSQWGNQHWATPLQQQTSDSVAATRHHGAAVAIGRRGLGVAIRRRPAGPRNGQRTAAGAPPGRHDRHPSSARRRRSSGSPTSTGWMPVHRRTPAASSQHRSGRNRARVILLTNQER